MKIAGLNSVFYGSTGKIMRQIAESGKDRHEFLLCAPNGRHNPVTPDDNCFVFGGRWDEDIHLAMTRFTGLHGCFSKSATRSLIKRLEEFDPDVLHMHNLHSSYVNLEMLFDYIKQSKVKTVWTLHDCWAFTGHCPHYLYAGCDKWLTECGKCPIYKSYPNSYVDTSRLLFAKKQEWFCGVENMTIVTPSEWLAGEVKRSFLGDYPVRVINNGIDLGVFKPCGDFKQKHGIEDKKMVLGVSFNWNERKGIDVFVRLAQMLGDEYKVVLVGVKDDVKEKLPKQILAIGRTQSQQELAEIYSAADVFVNATREDNFPTVNIEAIACGTPVVTFDVGGSKEMLDDTCGIVVKLNDIDGMYNSIVEVCGGNGLTADACQKRAGLYNMYDRFSEYIRLYEEV